MQKGIALLAIAFLVGCQTSIPEGHEIRAGLSTESVEIAGESFYLAYTNSSVDGFLKEYLLRKQTLKDWEELFAI